MQVHLYLPVITSSQSCFFRGSLFPCQQCIKSFLEVTMLSYLDVRTKHNSDYQLASSYLGVEYQSDLAAIGLPRVCLSQCYATLSSATGCLVYRQQ